MILHKAKTLTGEWVKGYYLNDGHHRVFKGLKVHNINPSTLCQQVPSKDWFVGDEIKWGGNFSVVGYVVFDEKSMSYKVESEQGRMIITDNWKPTGRNKHDDE